MGEISDYLSEIGKRGGKATKDNHGPDYYKTIGKRGGRPIDPNSARQQRLRKATTNSGPSSPKAQ
jgi:general stress protein YciG